MRIPSLDGLRALSIVLVLFGHLNGTRGFGVHLEVVGDVAHLGVRVFFVISGFLITSLLLKEERVALGQFYWRRFYRIFPPFYFYLGAVGLLSAAGLLADIPSDDLIAALTYTTNFQIERAWLVGHTWSLSVEEQFYLLWPGVLALLGRDRALKAAAIVVVCAPVVRLGWNEALPGLRLLIGEAFPTVMDSIATGCLLAGFRARLHADRRYRSLLELPFLVPVVVFALLVINRQSDHARAFWLVGETCLNVGVAFLIDRAVTRPETPFGQILNFRPLAHVGVASYSIYLWQQVFLDRSSTAWFTAFPVNIVLALAAGFGSYHLVEKPIMKYRDRLIPGHKPAAPRRAPEGA
ncbi:MAG: acyltransferase [Myxococcales bacterium]|nr:acyltransferase [Myxococcales bacterium]